MKTCLLYRSILIIEDLLSNNKYWKWIVRSFKYLFSSSIGSTQPLKFFPALPPMDQIAGKSVKLPLF